MTRRQMFKARFDSVGSKAVATTASPVCTRRHTLTAMTIVSATWLLPQLLAGSAVAWLPMGDYLLLGTLCVLDCGYRRWRFRHLSDRGLHAMLILLARHWPPWPHGNRMTRR